ncbi:hypothetical protein HAX54_022136 [Datura stramonium]|uniref:Uncharacterized protein n=1 Tax=Datura stramonium TaxID=4076 RepID=A0ABS8UWR8_DATST|nr:hypothetical protein [Datura stramonium]
MVKHEPPSYFLKNYLMQSSRGGQLHALILLINLQKRAARCARVHEAVVSIEKSGQHSNLNVAEKLLDKNPEVDNLQHHTEGCVRTGKPPSSPNQYDHVMQRFEQCMGANSELNFNEKHDIVQQVENSIVMN